MTVTHLEVDLESLYTGEDTDWENVDRMCETAKNSSTKLYDLIGSNDIRTRFASIEEHFSAIELFVATWKDMRNAQERLTALLEMDFDCYGNSDWLSGQNAMCSDILENADGLREWMVWKNISGELRNAELTAVIDAYEAGLSHDAIIPTYRKAVYFALIISTVESDDTLNGFSGAVFNEKIEQFKRVDTELTELTKKEIFYRLAAKIPDFSREAAQNSELGILQKAIRSGGRGISIRKLFEQIPNLLPRLCPCMLMSPISAAQYLDPKRLLFDVVVFDEASQLPTCKAVGALARGKEAIIVGDPKQMPPTSFFSSNTADEENLDTEDLDSILDDCLALSMPQTHLLWHYRSHHESLIAFSNNQFYENKLYTFPSVNDRESKVKLIHIDGCFDRGKSRQNRVEAEAIVKEVVRRYKDPELRKYTVGVVTFNISQQKLIEDLFTESCETDSGLDAWANDSDEPLFIKNLENVQGDERDAILFSVGYGPDKEGKIFMNFGPLNREEGWRRLNVAVSRARYEMLVFSSLTPEQINLSKTRAKGVTALKAFLEYAQQSSMSIGETSSERWRITRGGIADCICHALNDAGYDTQCAVGHSEYRIDIGVVDPRSPERYLLGVLLDGPTYGSAKTTRDRELAQISVLNGLGWDVHRIWTMDWWDNNRKEMDKLLKKLEYLKKQSVDETPAVEIPSIIKPVQEASSFAGLSENETVRNTSSLVANSYQSENNEGMCVTETAARNYVSAILPVQTVTADEFILPGYTGQLGNKFQLVLQAEAPISEALLIKRVLQSCGIARAGNRVQARSATLLVRLGVKFTEHEGQKFYWNDDQDPSSYEGFRVTGEGNNKRDAKDVPVHEAANAVCAVLEEQIGLPREDLIREAAKKLGYARTGPLVVAAVENGIHYAKSVNRILFDDYGYVTLNTQY